MSQPAFVRIWEFALRSGTEQEFVKHNGPEGTWAALFEKAPGYLGTTLLRDLRRPRRFLTVDRWESEAAFRAFLDAHATAYGELDRRLGDLTTGETSLGEFLELGC